MKQISLLLVLFLLASCKETGFVVENQQENSPLQVKIVSWNLQTFFDAVKVGTEYSDFISKKSSWSEEKYKTRLTRFCEILEFADSDIFIMQEIENENILYDIINSYRLQGRRDKAYLYGGFISENGQSFGCGVLSKIPIYNLKSHQVDIRSEPEKQPDMRPLMEFSLDGSGTKRIFVCHWKSKSGGKEETEIWRDYQQSLLQTVVKNQDYNFVVCGDFNRDLKDFNIEDEYLILNDDINFSSSTSLSTEENKIKLKSCWIDFSTEDEGSYFYQNEWEKIDHFFVSKNCEVKEFYTIKNGPNITEEGIPFRYNLWNGSGYSDHLPIVCTVIF